jgi:hypothetical protein
VATTTLFYQVSDESILLALAPDYNALAKIETRGVIVTCTHTSGQFNGVSFPRGPSDCEPPLPLFCFVELEGFCSRELKQPNE